MFEQLNKAEQDLYTALQLAESIIFGYIEAEWIDLLEMYYLLKKWQVRMGDKILNSLEELIDRYEDVLEDIDEELLDNYLLARQTEDICEAVVREAEAVGLPKICLINPDNIPEA